MASANGIAGRDQPFSATFIPNSMANGPGTGITIKYVPTIAAIWGLVVTGVYLLRAVRDTWFGEPNPRWDGLKDAVTATQKHPFIVLILVLVFTGCFPGSLVDTIESGVRSVISRVQSVRVAAEEER